VLNTAQYSGARTIKLASMELDSSQALDDLPSYGICSLNDNSVDYFFIR